MSTQGSKLELIPSSNSSTFDYDKLVTKHEQFLLAMPEGELACMQAMANMLSYLFPWVGDYPTLVSL